MKCEDCNRRDDPECCGLFEAPNPDLTALVEAAIRERLIYPYLAESLIPQAVEGLLPFARAIFAAGRDAQREDDAQIDWLQLVRDHDMQGYVCSCGADVNDQDRHLALSIQAAIGSSKPTEEDN